MCIRDRLIVTLVAFLLPDSRSERRIDLPPVEGVLGLEEVKCMIDVESLSCLQVFHWQTRAAVCDSSCNDQTRERVSRA